MRLLTCSNSGPVTPSAGGHGGANTPPPGGLVPMLTALLGEAGGVWLFSAGPEATGQQSSIRQPNDVTWVPVTTAEPETQLRSRAAAIELFLWVFHYLYDTSVGPSFDGGTLAKWRAYDEVNERFGRAMAASHTNSPDELVLVHDFHLMLVPGRFSELVRRRTSRLAYFHHVPWCDPAYFGLLPDEVRRAVLSSLLMCDFAGFHCRRWARNFMMCCQEYLSGVDIDGNALLYRDHRTVVSTAPGPVDADSVKALSNSPLAHQWRESLASRAGDRRLVVRVDRVDLWKNIDRGFAAYELMLERTPSIAEEYWFCAIVSSPRYPNARHADYEARCRAAQARINDRFGGRAEAVSMVYPERENHRTRALAALSLADVVLVNSTFDGLNMVAKESLVVNSDASLLLSRNAGAFDQLAPAVTAVDPFDVLSTADLLESAIRRPARTPAGERNACIDALRAETAGGWLEHILNG